MEVTNFNRAELLAKWQPTIDKTFDIFSWTTGHELAGLCEFATKAQVIAEVGSYHGKSAKCMALANPAATLFCIDKPESTRCHNILRENLHDELIAQRASIHVGTTDTMNWADLPALINLGFVDGGHLKEDVQGDIRHLLPRMAPGAILCGHDWRLLDPNDGVNQAVLSFFPRERLTIFESIWWVKL